MTGIRVLKGKTGEELKDRDKVYAIVSGGMDSVTLLYWLKAAGVEPVAISFHYGQKHYKELGFAESICHGIEVEHRVINMRPLMTHLDSSSLTNRELDVPEGHYADENMKSTVVPNRNMMMLSIASAMAINDQAAGVAIGVHAGDHAIYPDCRPEFITSFEATLHIANEGFIKEDFQVIAPFVQNSKTEIAKIGWTLGVPFEDTWSCYKGGVLHCGRCGTCVERKEAFHDAGLIDPTDYYV